MELQQIINVMTGVAEPSAGLLALLVALSVWSLVWKGIALWKAARNASRPWFIALLVINSVGILEIIYIFFFADKKKKEEAQPPMIS